MKVENKYNMSFTSCAFCLYETQLLAELYLKYKDWDKVKQEAISQNLLQYRTTTALKRIVRELIARLQTLPQELIEFLPEATSQEKQSILWYAICNTYPFIKDFYIEVIQEHRSILRFQLQLLDFDSFFNAKANLYDNVANLTTATRNKLRQVLIKMLKEADIINKDLYIRPTYISNRVKEIILKHKNETQDTL